MQESYQPNLDFETPPVKRACREDISQRMPSVQRTPRPESTSMQTGGIMQRTRTSFGSQVAHVIQQKQQREGHSSCKPPKGEENCQDTPTGPMDNKRGR